MNILEGSMSKRVKFTVRLEPGSPELRFLGDYRDGLKSEIVRKALLFYIQNGAGNREPLAVHGPVSDQDRLLKPRPAPESVPVAVHAPVSVPSPVMPPVQTPAAETKPGQDPRISKLLEDW
jgi:hypothetical protein